MTQRMLVPSRSRTALLVLNGAGALIATGFAVAGLARPSIAEPRSGAGRNTLASFWAASSAVRTIAVTGPLLTSLLTDRGPSPQVVSAAGFVQLGDAALGLRQRNPFMAVAPALMGAIHLITARALRAKRAAREVALASRMTGRCCSHDQVVEQSGSL